LRQVAVNLFIERAETAVYGANAADTCIVNAFDGTYPQVDVGVHRVLNQYGDVHAFESIGHFLHSKRIGRSAGAYPEHVYIVSKGFAHMGSSGHFHGGVHAEFCFYTF
jgi:hypothetical protein